MSMWRKLTREERFGLSVTAVLHVLVVLLAWLMVSEPKAQHRAAFIEITLGEFQDGTMAEFSRVEQPTPQTRPDPVETIAEEPSPDPVVEPQPVPQTEEPARDVELPEQPEPVDATPVPVPDAEEIDPSRPETTAPQTEEPSVPAPAIRAETESEGEPEAGDIRGIRGRVDADQGTGADPIRSAPFQLEWEGDFNRAPVVQSLPNYVSQTEATIRVRFEVRPDGTVGQVIPQVRGNPELDREVIRTLRTWRFSRLPSNMPQESQFGVVTFRFILE
jgi:TonB family protein